MIERAEFTFPPGWLDDDIARAQARVLEWAAARTRSKQKNQEDFMNGPTDDDIAPDQAEFLKMLADRALAEIGPRTVTVNGSHWPVEYPWTGLHLSKCVADDLFSGGGDYYLRVPFCHPVDTMPDRLDDFARYKLRPKPPWQSFASRLDGHWLVSRPVG